MYKNNDVELSESMIKFIKIGSLITMIVIVIISIILILQLFI
ncbi:hypothetical protein [Caloranaerobacter azorensis]|nr:hypothetical protein [Caloranaerobacter azorensis]